MADLDATISLQINTIDWREIKYIEAVFHYYSDEIVCGFSAEPINVSNGFQIY